MESVASNSTPPPDQQHHRRFRHNQPVTDRIGRALRHHLRLLHRTNSSIFFVLGATGNVYTVTLSSSPSCTCPDRITPCKHILFVYIRVLGVSLEDTCLQRRTLSPYHLNRLLNKPTFIDSLAGAGLRKRFHELFFQERNNNNAAAASSSSNTNNDNTNKNVDGSVVETKEDGSACPICLEDKGKGGGRRVVKCGTCRNWIHEECFMGWKRSRGRRRAICVICRAKWRVETVQEKYLNLGAYVNYQEDNGHGDNNGGAGGGLCAG